MTALTVIILTRDEELHIARAIASVRAIATKILVVDSGSTDTTVDLARAAGATVLHHPWVNYAQQFNWAAAQCAADGGWVMRLDADEVVTPQLQQEILTACSLDSPFQGLTCQRRMCFLGAPIRHGGVFPITVLRLFRAGLGRCEDRWMDEHLIVDGSIGHLSGAIVDDNRKPLDWWVSKHNAYANREVIDILNQRHGFLPLESIAEVRGGQAAVKRWIKERIYARLPTGLRAAAYFAYRYFLRLGFLDGPQARQFHVLQGFWYRYLVDAKLCEVQRHMTDQAAEPVAAIKAMLGIDLSPHIQSERQAA